MKLKITLVKSPIGYCERQKRTVLALGLRKMNHFVVQPDNDAIRGMAFKVRHLVELEEIADEPAGEA